jgi:hypothetical protein
MYFHIFGTLYPIIIEISFCNLVAPVTNQLKMYTISLHYNTPRVLVGSVVLFVLFFCVVFFVLFVFVLCFVFPMLSLSLNCPFLIATSVFSIIYMRWKISLIWHIIILTVDNYDSICKRRQVGIDSHCMLMP